MQADRARGRAGLERAPGLDGAHEARLRRRAQGQPEDHLHRHVRVRPGRALSRKSPRTTRSSRARQASPRCTTAPQGEPRYLPMVMADKTVGLIAVQMILMALFHRERTGEGQAIEIPMFENMAAFVLSEHMYLKTFDPPRGTDGRPASPRSAGQAARDEGRLYLRLGQHPGAGFRAVRRDRPAGAEDRRALQHHSRALQERRRVLPHTRRSAEGKDHRRVARDLRQVRRARDALPHARFAHGRPAPEGSRVSSRPSSTRPKATSST